MLKTPTIRVLIADDHAILRSGLKMLIDAQHDMTVVAEAANSVDAIHLVRQTVPDVVILDITMAEGGGLNAISEISKCDPSPQVLMLTMHEEPAYLRTAQAAGASGYVLKKVWMQTCSPRSARSTKDVLTWIRNLPTASSSTPCRIASKMAPRSLKS
jgi:Response regulator containing a CheY-like receiver domain and an HTH DNA-binding domain